MRARPEGCRGCPADTVARGFVSPTGPTTAAVALVGQGPGQDEATFGEPFIGNSGRRLSAWCERADLPREKAAVGNVVFCQLPSNRKPKVAEARYCWAAHVRPWLTSLPNLRVIVAIGVPAMQVFLGSKAGASLAGTIHPYPTTIPQEPYAKPTKPPSRKRKRKAVLPVQESNRDPLDLPLLPGESEGGEGSAAASVAVGSSGVDSGTVVGGGGSETVGTVAPDALTVAPILHPAAIIRGQFSAEPAQPDYLRRAWQIATGATTRDIPDVTQPPPNATPTPTIADLHHFKATTEADDVLACDGEWPRGKLAGIGFCRLRDEHSIYVPVLDGERDYWGDDWKEADSFIRWGLTQPTVFHSGQSADLPVFAQYGYTVSNYIDDTMIRHHTLYAEQRKKLDMLAIRYLGFPSWKWTRTVEEDDNK